MTSDPVKRVRDHVERHKGRERAMFSIAGLQAVLEENARLRCGLERLASPEAFTVPRMTNEEERARMFYAEAVLAGEADPEEYAKRRAINGGQDGENRFHHRFAEAFC